MQLVQFKSVVVAWVFILCWYLVDCVATHTKTAASCTFDSCITNGCDGIEFNSSASPESGAENDHSICIVTRNTLEIESYSRISSYIQREYASLHGYKIFFENDNVRSGRQLDEEDYKFYPKLSLILSVLLNFSNNCEYVAWMDADFIPLDFNFSLRIMIEKHSSKFFIASKDASNMINTGAMILRNSEWSHRLLTKWLMLRHFPHAINDQTGFDLLYTKYMTSEDKDNIAILEMNELNSAAPAMSRQKFSDKFLHLAAEDNDYRKVVFCIAAASIASTKKIAQLNVTSINLQRMGVIVYGEVSVSIRNQILIHLQQFGISQVNPVMSLLSRYRTVASKFLHAKVHLESQGQESNFSLTERWKLVQLYAFAAQSLIESCNWPEFHIGGYVQSQWSAIVAVGDLSKALFSPFPLHSINKEFVVSAHDANEVFSAIPELLKMLLEISFEYLVHAEQLQDPLEAGALVDGNAAEIEIVLLQNSTNINYNHHTLSIKLRNSFISDLLVILKNIVRSDQKHIVDNMIKDFHTRYSFDY